MRVAVIIPTYNEAGRIGKLLEEAEAVFARSPEHEWHIVVVDANSPDGTGEIVRNAATHYRDIHVITEKEKRGLGMAYVAGMRYAMEELRADAYIEFDGDGQHNPEYLPRLVAEIEDGFDYVIGSRYVKGGSIPQEWALYRKVLSRFGGLIARFVLELPVHDATSGLKATSTASASRFTPLTEDKLLSRQFARLQILNDAVRSGVRIKEIPIVFGLRDRDVSKGTWRDIFESLRLILVLRGRSLRQWRLLRILCVGAVGFAVQSIVFEFLGIYFHVVRPSTAILIGGELAILSNFYLNGKLSFGDLGKPAQSFGKRIIRFHLVSFGSILIQWLCVNGAETFFGTKPEILWVAYLIGIALGFISNYIGYSLWVWNE